MNTMISVDAVTVLCVLVGGAFCAGAAVVLTWMVQEKNRIIDELVEAIHGPEDDDDDEEGDPEDEPLPTEAKYLNSKWRDRS